MKPRTVVSYAADFLDWLLGGGPGEPFLRLSREAIDRHVVRVYHEAKVRSWWRLACDEATVERIRAGRPPLQTLCDQLPHLRARRMERNGFVEPVNGNHKE